MAADLLAEYTEFSQVPTVLAVPYKYFSLFRVEEGELVWAGHRATLAEDLVAPVKKFLKEQRAALRSGSLSKSECSRRMWFWVQKVLELELFLDAPEARAQMLKWTEVCELVIS
jgi:hypothetical protein